MKHSLGLVVHDVIYTFYAILLFNLFDLLMIFYMFSEEKN